MVGNILKESVSLHVLRHSSYNINFIEKDDFTF